MIITIMINKWTTTSKSRNMLEGRMPECQEKSFENSPKITSFFPNTIFLPSIPISRPKMKQNHINKTNIQPKRKSKQMKHSIDI
ncbi:MAG: hypothetical protein Ta2E_11600 [Mycoplasmoidaceae bacterium]|nr:MAG: hypothetical protein Ta2E_11600 [Mycoplasmoidaceae bacterium]